MDVKRVVVTGMGVICPLGLNIDEFWTNLIAGKSGIAQARLDMNQEQPERIGVIAANMLQNRYIGQGRITSRNRGASHRRYA